MSRTIYILWKFDEQSEECKLHEMAVKTGEVGGRFRVSTEHGDQIVCFPLKVDQGEEEFKQIVQAAIVEFRRQNASERLLLLHNKPEHQLAAEWESIVHRFGGGESHQPWIYSEQGLLGERWIRNDAFVFVDGHDVVKGAVYDRIWDMYTLFGLRREIVDAWLPLAIDLQGLSETKEKKTQDYQIYLSDVAHDYAKDGAGYFAILKDSAERVFMVAKLALAARPEPESTAIMGQLRSFKCLADHVCDGIKRGILDRKYLDPQDEDFLPTRLENILAGIDNLAKRQNRYDSPKVSGSLS